MTTAKKKKTQNEPKDEKPEVIDLEDLIPMHSEFELKKFPDHTFRLRPLDLDDKVWAQKTFGDQFSTSNMSTTDCCRIVYHQLDQESRALLPAQSVEEYDDDGELVQIKLKGYEMLKRAIDGPKELGLVFRAMLTTFGISNPILEKITDEDIERLKKKAEQARRTGAKSST